MLRASWLSCLLLLVTASLSLASQLLSLRSHPSRQHGMATPSLLLRLRGGVYDEPPAIVIIGISGGSRSGKTTLAKQLASELEGATVLSQDDFADGRLAAQHPSGFEASESIAHDDLRSVLSDARESGSFRYVIVEGFRTFVDPLLVQSLDVLIWLNVSRGTCHERRMVTDTVSESFFTQHLWARHVEYEANWKARLVANAELRSRLQVLDGEQEEQEDTLQEALRAVHAAEAVAARAAQVAVLDLDPMAERSLTPPEAELANDDGGVEGAEETVAWPMTKLMRAAAAVTADKRLAVLLTTGAMNPPHAGHLQMLHQAAARLRKQGYTVVGAWLSPSHNEYVIPKAASLGTVGLSAAFRLEVSRRMCVGDSLVDVASWEASQPGSPWPDYPEVVTALCSALDDAAEAGELPAITISVFYACGTDHAENCNLYSGFHPSAGVVVVPRVGETPEAEDPSRLVFVAESEPSHAAFSSTGLRAAIATGGEARVRAMVPSEAAALLLRPDPAQYDRYNADYEALGILSVDQGGDRAPATDVLVETVRQPLPATDVLVEPEKWFSHLFGFDEDGDDGAGMRAQFELRGSTLRSKVNGASYGVGRFTTPSLAELRAEAAHTPLPSGRLSLSHIATRDVFALHSSHKYAGATFQVASQFNCLEFQCPDAGRGWDVTDYIDDHTQGPACALASPAATVYRNYFAAVGGQRGQTRSHQLNLLADVLVAVQGSRGESWQQAQGLGTGEPEGDAVGPSSNDLVSVRNGFSYAANECLVAFNERFNTRCVVDKGAREQLLGRMRIGVHSGIEAPWGARRFVLQPPERRQLLSQVFCSALSAWGAPLSMGRGDDDWAPLATLVLDAAYEATLLSAALETAAGSGSGVVLLTYLGGGVFGNREEWIEGAIARACHRLRAVGLKVVVVHYEHVDQGSVERIARRLDELEEEENGDME